MSMAALERKIDQLVARVRELEEEVVRLRSSDERARRGFAEVLLAGAESGDTLPAAIGAVASGEQTIVSGGASILEIVDAGGGVFKLKPVQNAAGSNKAKVSYFNAANSSPQTWTAANEPMLLVRLRDGRFVRFPAGGGGTDLDVLTGFTLVGNTIFFTRKKIKATIVSTPADVALADLTCG